MIEKGDKVRFLDEALEGTVVSLIGKDRAEVITTDGFTMVALLKQLVKVREESEEKRMTQRPVVEPPVVKVEMPPQRKKTAGRIFAFDEEELKEQIVYVAFELVDPESPLTSAVQLCVVNNTDSTVAFSLSKKFEMRDEGIAIDKLEPRSLKSFFTYTQEELCLFEAIRAQIIFHPGGKAVFRPPVQKQFRFNVNELLESQDFIAGKTNCLFIQLTDMKQPPEIDITPLVNKFSDTEKELTAAGKTRKIRPVRVLQNVIYADEKTVDLHIEELLKDFSTMNNAQIIAYQLKHFQYEMDQAIIHHMRKITFIHGVGTGVLRSAIREELKRYNNIRFNDAPVEKFGYGATEIIFD